VCCLFLISDKRKLATHVGAVAAVTISDCGRYILFPKDTNSLSMLKVQALKYYRERRHTKDPQNLLEYDIAKYGCGADFCEYIR
jgi:hypothetical protein